MSATSTAVILIDNSISFTGAFKCALQQARLMQDMARYVFVLPQGSHCAPLAKAEGFSVYTLPMQEVSKSIGGLLQYPFRLLSNAVQLQKIIQAEGAGIVVMNDFYNLLGVALKLTGAGFRLITYVRFLPHAVPAPLRRLWVGAAMRHAYSVVAVSNAVLQQLPRYPKVQCMYDALDFSEQHAPFGVRPNAEEINLLYLGNYIRGKGQNLALEAFIKAYAFNKRLRLHFYGGDMGLQKNKIFRQELERTAGLHGLAQVVHFKSFATDTEAVYKSADIFLNFSEGESFSMTCAEAAYYGIPTIASRCGGPEEIIEHGKTGLLMPNRDVDAFAAAIMQLANEVQLRQQFSEASPVHVQQKFSRAAFKNSFGALLQVA